MTQAQPSSFSPPFGLRSTLVQSVLATKRPAKSFWRKRGVDLAAISTRHVFDVADEQGHPARLAGYFTPKAGAKALVVLIHGWEGSHESNYLYSMAAAQHAAGHAVFRLNMRDHGDSHGLNEGLFHSARLTEVLQAVKAAQQLAPELPLFVVGFSLGGNFALRVALHGAREGLNPRLCVGISPAINPHSTLRGIDDGPALFNRYFISKWHKTLAAKEGAWPGRYDFQRHRRIRNFVEITRAFVEDYTEFDTLEDYLGVYTLTPAQLMASALPLAIFTACDDSVCPPADFEGLQVGGPLLAYEATACGGHCGFIENWRLESWAEARVTALIAQLLA